MPNELGHRLECFKYKDGDQGCPYLDHHSVLSCANKCFDVQQLLDLAEKYFNLPSAFVKFANRVCYPAHVISGYSG